MDTDTITVNGRTIRRYIVLDPCPRCGSDNTDPITYQFFWNDEECRDGDELAYGLQCRACGFNELNDDQPMRGASHAN